jgi:hypothetical protein
MEVSSQLHAPVTLQLGKETLIPLDRRLGGPQSRSGRGGEEKNSHLPPRILNHLNPFHTSASYFANIQFNIILPSIPMSPKY